MLLVLVSCGGKQTEDKKPDLSNYRSAKGYEAKIDVCSNDISYSFKFTRMKPDSMTIGMLKPEILKNFRIIYENNISLFKFGDFTVSMENFPLPINEGLGKICKVLKNVDNAFENLKLIVKDSHTITYKSVNEEDKSDFEIDIDTQKLIPIEVRLKINNVDYLITITDFQFIL